MFDKRPDMSKVNQIVASIHADKNDPEGAYTGTPLNPHEKPVQDADDL
jgi:hypothetical protein